VTAGVGGAHGSNSTGGGGSRSTGRNGDRGSLKELRIESRTEEIQRAINLTCPRNAA
jgi:hypothetical protein